MMDARTGWHTWRRVMREERLQAAMFGGRLAEQAAELGLSPSEREVVEHYASSPAGTRFFITNYRFRMTSSFVYALETAAPLTHRLLRANHVDLAAVTREFLDSVGWRDFGPYVFTYGGRILDRLAERPDLASLHGLPELIAVEQAGVRITIGAAEDPERTAAVPDRYRAVTAAAAVDVGLDLSSWLRDGATLGRTRLPTRPCSYLVHLRAPDLQRRIVSVPPAAARMLRALVTPMTADELAVALDGSTPERGDGAALLAKLVRLGVVLAPRGRG